MQVNLGLFNINELPRIRGSESHHDGQGLRDSEPDVGDADEVVGAALLRTRQAPTRSSTWVSLIRFASIFQVKPSNSRSALNSLTFSGDSELQWATKLAT